jgi:hypothetical protein
MCRSISHLLGVTLNIIARFPISHNEFASEEIGSLSKGEIIITIVRTGMNAGSAEYNNTTVY